MEECRSAQKANPSLFCTSKYLQSLSLRRGTAFPPAASPPAPGTSPRRPAQGELARCRAPGHPVLPDRGGLRWTPARGFVRPLSLPLGTGKQVPQGAQQAPGTLRQAIRHQLAHIGQLFTPALCFPSSQICFATPQWGGVQGRQLPPHTPHGLSARRGRPLLPHFNPTTDLVLGLS